MQYKKNLNLIIINQGGTDHTGNCFYLRKTYGVKIAMNHDDKGMVEKRDMLWNRKGNVILKIINHLMGLVNQIDSSQIFILTMDLNYLNME